MKKEDKNPMGKKRRSPMNIEITELFMAKKGKTGWTWCFHGVIHREKDAEGNATSVNSNITLPGEGMIWSRDVNQDKCGENLDDMVELRLDRNIHGDSGVTSEIAGRKYFHN